MGYFRALITGPIRSAGHHLSSHVNTKRVCLGLGSPEAQEKQAEFRSSETLFVMC